MTEDDGNAAQHECSMPPRILLAIRVAYRADARKQEPASRESAFLCQSPIPSSPRGIHDREGGVHQGFDALTNYIHLHEPRLVIHGHQHMELETVVGRTRVIGVYGHRLLAV